MNASPVRVRLLGTAAGGGLPQWNCACRNCQEARNGRIPRRGQCLIALDSPGGSLLLNAPPDVSELISRHVRLHPVPGSPRNSRIGAIFLTSADLDHSLGILSLREGEPLDICAPARIRQTLDAGLNLTGVLDNFCGVQWRQPPVDDWAPVFPHSGKASQLEFRAIPLPGHVPRLAKGASADEVHRVAYEFVNRATGRRLVVATDAAEITGPLKRAMETADAVLFDGTFWSEDELARIKPSAATASGMGHLPMEQSLEVLRTLPARDKIYIHINNTNPALLPGSKERAVVEGAGVVIPDDGHEFEL